MDGAAEYAHTCSSSTWRLDAPSLSALRAAATSAQGRVLLAEHLILGLDGQELLPRGL